MEFREFLHEYLTREIREHKACPSCRRPLADGRVEVTEEESDPPTAWPAKVAVTVGCGRCEFTRTAELDMTDERRVAIGQHYRRMKGPVSADDLLDVRAALAELPDLVSFTALFGTAIEPAPPEVPVAEAAAAAASPDPRAQDPLLNDATQEIERLREALRYCRRAMRSLVLAQGGTVRVPYRVLQDVLVREDYDELVGNPDGTANAYVWQLRRKPGAPGQ